MAARRTLRTPAVARLVSFPVPSAPAPAVSPSAVSPLSAVSPQEVLMAGLYVALWRYGAASSFAPSDSALAAHWPGHLTPGAALVIGCVSPEVAGGRPRLTLAPQLTSAALTEAEAERARLATHGVAARLAAYAQIGRSGRFVYRAWGRGYRLMEAPARVAGPGRVAPACARCQVADADGVCERKASVVRQIMASEPGARVFIAHGPGGSAAAEMERAAI